MLSNSLIHRVASGNAMFLPIFNLLRRWAPDGDCVACSAVFHSPPGLTSSLLWLAAGRGGRTPPPSELWPDAGTWGSWWPGCPHGTALSSVKSITPNLARNQCSLCRASNRAAGQTPPSAPLLVLHMARQAQGLALFLA